MYLRTRIVGAGRCNSLGLTLAMIVVCNGSAQEGISSINVKQVAENRTPVLVTKFANRQQAAEQLLADDGFFPVLSQFDLQVRLQSGQEVTVEDLKRRIGVSTFDWTAEEEQKLLAVVRHLEPKLAKWRIPWPEIVWLAKTNGKEDADAPYTRGTTIVFPQRILAKGADELERLMVHELFHILSRQSVEFRTHMYAVIGFQLCDEIPLPDSIVKRKITNPDAPRIDCYQMIRQGNNNFPVTPVIFSRNDFDPRAGGNLFKSLEFRLMQLEEVDGKFRPSRQAGNALLLDPKLVPDFHAQIGRNTGYIIHPDEVLADNFVFLVSGADKKLASPEIVEGMKNVVTRPAP